jgi:uncharacterized iron-regulated membrane protein
MPRSAVLLEAYVSASEVTTQIDGSSGGRWYNAVWRWHFYAGLFCIPFVIWLSLTGLIYLWRPQIEAWLDRPYDNLIADGPVASPDAQVTAALKAVPGATLSKYILPESPQHATRIIVANHGDNMRVYIDPRSLAVLNVVSEEKRPMRLLFHLHGELLAGAIGSYIVEIAACWAIVMILTGLYLWWPRGRLRFAGVLYPRLRSSSRVFWRDLHATAGVWVSVFALGLVLTGLPWAKGWGTYLTEVRHLTGASRGPVDWTIGGAPPKQDPMIGDHAGHIGVSASTASIKPGELARVIAAVMPLNVAAPVMIAPPKHAGEAWSIKSDAADRPLRSDLTIDGATGTVLGRTDFEQRHWIDQTIGYGVALHEGALFGLANQIIGSLTAVFLVILAVSGGVMWWRRRPIGLLGAPLPRERARFGSGLIAVIAALAVYMPMFGVTLMAVLLMETFVFRRFDRVSRWLGLVQNSSA